MKKILLGIAAVALLLTSCSKDFLNTEPSGSGITQNQYDRIHTSFDANVNGIYEFFLTPLSKDHAIFGQKGIDIHTDLAVGDMALRGRNYGWFWDAASMQEVGTYSGFGGWMWISYYYSMIKNCNMVLVKRDPNVNYADQAALTELQQSSAYSFGQALAMRGFAYFWLVNYFGKQYGVSGQAPDINAPAVPIYVETDPAGVPHNISTAAEVYQRAENDLLEARAYLKGFERTNKTVVDTNVVSCMLAYLYLQRGCFNNDNTDLTEAAKYANSVIASGAYPVLPLREVLKNGFNDIRTASWIWGYDVTIETTTALASFFGQMDVFTYSYAFAGDYKAIDDALYAQIPSSDIRRRWFQDRDSNSLVNQNYPLAPMQKFYSSNRVPGGDRIWTNDLVFMRIEEMYLVAAEAQSQLGATTEAVATLQTLVNQRDTAMTIDAANFSNQLIYNWRVEMWGEGRSMLMRKRMNYSTPRGQNHLIGVGQGIDPQRLYYRMPSSETEYNTNI